MRVLVYLLMVVLCFGAVGQELGPDSFLVRAVTEDGAPVAGAEVLCLPYVSHWRFELPREDERFVTDDDGVAAIDVANYREDVRNNLSIRITKGELVGYERVYPDKNYAQPYEIEVKDRPETTGIVRGADGGPLEGVLIGSEWFPLMRTGADGRFTISGEGNGTGSLTFYKEGYAPYSAGNSQGYLDLTLERGVSVTFKVVNPAGEPMPNVTVRFGKFVMVTDEGGIATSPTVDPNWRTKAKASFRTKESGYWGELELLPSEAADTVQTLALEKRWERDASGQVTSTMEREATWIAGRVVMVGTGEPVRAAILMTDTRLDFEYRADREGASGDDGQFRIEDLSPGRYYVTARPFEKTLYCEDGVVEVNVSDAPKEDLVFTVDRGCAVQGEIVSEGPIKQHWVNLDQDGYQRRMTIPTRRGRFSFENLPPEPKTITIAYERNDIVVTLPAAGEVVRDVEIVLPMESEKVSIQGQVVDEAGNPQSGVSLTAWLTPSVGVGKSASSATTDSNGRFNVGFEEPGDVRFTVTRMMDIQIGNSGRSMSPHWPILEGENATLDAGQRMKDYRLVVEPVNLQFVRGVVVDEDGNRMNPMVRAEGREPGDDRGLSESVHEGHFIVAPSGYQAKKFPDVFLLVFTETGYEARILQSGIDFEVGDDTIRVVMEDGPYEEEPSVWEQITGRPFTKEEVARTIRSDDIRRQFEQFERMATPREDRPAPPPVPPRPTEEQLARFDEIVALGADGSRRSIRELRELRQEAFELQGAPAPQESYTHAERMAETLRLMFLLCGMDERAANVNAYSARVDEGYERGAIMASDSGSNMAATTTYHMRRFGADWFVVEIGQTVVP